MLRCGSNLGQMYMLSCRGVGLIGSAVYALMLRCGSSLGLIYFHAEV